jgi:TetR/AcrR family transcriptional regulator
MRLDVLEKTRTDPRGTPAKILDAAEEVFAEHGYSGASTREIARRARVPFGAMHYHWGSKRLLWQAVCQRLIERTREALLRNLKPGTTPGEVLDNMTDAFVDMFLANRNHVRLVYRGALDDPRDPYVEKMTRELVDFGLGLLQEMNPNDVEDPEVAIFLISKAFTAAVVDETGQEAILGSSAFVSRPVRERLRAGLRRLARAVFNVKD